MVRVTDTKQRIICLDFEGTLVEEVWQLVARETGINELKITTREVPDSKALMQKRIEILNQNNIKLEDLVTISRKAQPFEGAKEFLARLKETVPRIAISTDLAEEFAGSLLESLDWPAFFGHKFALNSDGSISHYVFRQDNHKQKLVEAMQSLNLEVYVAGDSYNDIPMIQAADKGFLFRSTPQIREEFPDIPHTESYNELYEWLTAGLERPAAEAHSAGRGMLLVR